HRPELRVELQLERDALAERAPCELLHLLDDLVQVEDDRLHDVAAAEGEELARERSGALRGAADEVDVALLLGARELLVEEVGVAEDHREVVVEVVRDAAGELADEGELLGTRRALLLLALAGDVADDDDRLRAAAVLAARSPRGHREDDV